VQVALTPSATPLLTRDAMFKLKEAGLVRLGISLDGSTPRFTTHSADCRRVGADHSGIEWQRRRSADPGSHTISRHKHTISTLMRTF